MRLFKKTALLSLIILCLNFSALAATTSRTNYPISGTPATPQLDAFDRTFIPFLKKWRVPGASVAVMQDGEVVALRGYGWADIENKKPITPNSLFRIASASKTFTAVTILKLIQDGKLTLNDKVFDILNNLQPLPGKTINPQIHQITVQNLLQMSSGWFNPGAGHFDPMFGPWPKGVENLLSPELPASCQTTARLMMSMPLRHKPGTTFVYSNLDYCLLGLVINKVTGSGYGYQGYENYVKANILSPIHITDMAIGSTQLKYQLANEPHYYNDVRYTSSQEMKNSAYLPYSNKEILKKNFSNGGWLATAEDLATFIQALKHHQILNAQSLKFMQTKSAFTSPKNMDYYTMGGKIYINNGKTYWIQTGSFTGTNALVVSKPNDVTIAVIFNYRPAIFGFLSKFRPELRRILVNSPF